MIPAMRYVIYPDYMASRTDGDMHWIGVGDLRHLYRVPPDAHVVVMDGSLRARLGFHPREDDIVCRPRYDGNYPVFAE